MDACRACRRPIRLGVDEMILITGPLYSGKSGLARTFLPDGASFEDAVCRNAQALAESRDDLSALADELAQRYRIVTVTEVGGGVVPLDAGQRAAREAAGRLSCLLAQRADTVVRVFCGIPMVLKGELPA